MVVFSNSPHRCSEFPLVVLWHAAEVYEIVDLRLPACQRKKVSTVSLLSNSWHNIFVYILATIRYILY